MRFFHNKKFRLCHIINPLPILPKIMIKKKKLIRRRGWQWIDKRGGEIILCYFGSKIKENEVGNTTVWFREWMEFEHQKIGPS